MGLQKLTADQIREAIELHRQGWTAREIGDKIGVNGSTIHRALKKIEQVGTEKCGPPPDQPVNQIIDKLDIDGTVDILKMDRPLNGEELASLAKVDLRKWVLSSGKLKTWQGTHRVDIIDEKTGQKLASNKKVQFFASGVGFTRAVSDPLARAIIEFGSQNVRPLPKLKLGRKKTKKDGGYAVSWGLWDVHIGMYAWRGETGNDYDVHIAKHRVMNSIDDMVEELSLYPIDRIWMPIGNDYMHYDSVRKMTAQETAPLDSDSRYQKVYETGLNCLAHMINRALELTDDVRAFYVPGNHDPSSSYGIISALNQRFLNDPRVTFDMDATSRKYASFGGTLLGWEHGKDLKLTNTFSTFSRETRGKWDDATYRELQIGHKHRKDEKWVQGLMSTNELIIRMNPCLCATDAYHYKNGWLGHPIKSVEACRYDRTGIRGSHVVWAKDEERVRTASK